LKRALSAVDKVYYPLEPTNFRFKEINDSTEGINITNYNQQTSSALASPEKSKEKIIVEEGEGSKNMKRLGSN
jgi:hypothetical protein